jgi:DNA-binding MarR family transcriptional regulator
MMSDAREANGAGAGRAANATPGEPAEGLAALSLRLHAVAIRLLRTVRTEDARTGVTPARLSALSVLVFGGARTVGELAAAEQVAAPTMTRLVAGLEADGYVERSRDPNDGRVIRVAATGRAGRLLRRARARRVEVLRRRLDELGAEERLALAVLVPALERVLGQPDGGA